MAGDGVRWAGLLETPNGYVATVQSHMSKQVILTVETVHGLFPMMTGLHYSRVTLYYLPPVLLWGKISKPRTMRGVIKPLQDTRCEVANHEGGHAFHRYSRGRCSSRRPPPLPPLLHEPLSIM